MAADKKITIGIDLESRIARTQERVAQLKKSGGFTNNPKAEQQIQGIIQQLEALGKVTNPSFQELSKIGALFDRLTEVLLGVARATGGTSKEFQKLEKQLKEDQSELKKLDEEKGSIKKQGRVNESTGVYELYQQYQKDALVSRNIQSAKGKQIKGLNTFNKGFDSQGNVIEGYFQNPTEAKSLYDNLKNTQLNNAKRLEELNASIEKYKQSIEETTQKLVSQSMAEGAPIQGEIIKEQTEIHQGIRGRKEAKHNLEDAKQATAAIGELAKQTERQSSVFGKAFKQFTLYNIALRGVKKALREAVTTIKDLDKYLTEQAMVTGKTRKETYELIESYQKLAKETGATTKEIAGVATEYMKQGKTIQESLTLTQAAVSAAKVARVSVGDSVNYLTTALNGFRLSADDAMKVSDKFAAVAASSATDYDELAIALSKVASQANLAGMSIDYTTALLTKGLETTREAPETMGTALKTIIARMREMSDYGETLEDGTDINNVETQLAYVGIALRNTEGELRSTEEVLDELGRKWETLDKNQQAAVAKALAGTRQQSRLIAMMEDYDRVIELQEIAQRSQGATLAQSATYLEGMEASLNKISVGWEKIITSITDSEIIVGLFKMAGNFLENFGDFLSTTAGQVTIWTTIATLGVLTLGNKLREHEIAKEAHKLDLQREISEKRIAVSQQEKQKSLLEESIIKRESTILDLKNKKVAEEALIVQKKKEISELNELKIKLEQKAADNKITIEEKKRLKTIDASIGKTKKELKQHEAELLIAEKNLLVEEQKLASEKTELGLHSTKAKLANEELLQLESQVGLSGKILGIAMSLQGVLLLFKPIYAGILFLHKLINKEKNKEYVATLRQQAAEAKGFKKKLLNAGAQMAESVAAHPFWGWTVAAGILAAVGVSIFAIAGGFKESKTETEKASDKIKKLSNEIYKLNEAKNAIDGIADQFETLDKKIIKTNKDLEEMETLLEGASEKIDFTRGGKFDDDEAAARKANFENFSDNQKINFIREEQLAIEEEIRAKRRKQLEQFNKEGVNQAKLLEDAEVLSAIYATNNAYLYDQVDALKETGKYTDAELKATEKIGQAIMENLSAQEALNWAQSEHAKKLASQLAAAGSINIDGESIMLSEVLTSDAYGLENQIKAYKEIASQLSGETLEAFNKAYSYFKDFASSFSENSISLITNLGITADEINNLAKAMRKLGIEEELLTNRMEKLVVYTGNGMGVQDAIKSVFADQLTGLTDEEYKEAYNTILNAWIDATGVGINNMGQELDKLQNKVNNFYTNATKWGEMSANEQAQFIADNAELFENNAGLLSAFESGDYATIEEALRGSEALEWQRQTTLTQLRTELANEEAKLPENQNVAYKKYLEQQIAYWEDTEKVWKASLKNILDKEKQQLDDYKSYLEEKNKAEEEALNKRKEAYEKYFDSVAEMEEDQDYEDQVDLLSSNLAKLGSSTDANAMNQKKELENQLKELEQERLKELRERAQEAIIENIDDQIAEMNDTLDKLLESNRALLAAMNGELTNSNEFVANRLATEISTGATANELQSWLGNLSSVYGGRLGDINLADMKIREENNNLYLTVNDREVQLDTSSQQSVYDAIMKALTQVGGI